LIYIGLLKYCSKTTFKVHAEKQYLSEYNLVFKKNIILKISENHTFKCSNTLK